MVVTMAGSRRATLRSKPDAHPPSMTVRTNHAKALLTLGASMIYSKRIVACRTKRIALPHPIAHAA